jgi:hypothetical protein
MRRREKRLLDEVVGYYLASGDFNGLYVRPGSTSRSRQKATRELVGSEYLQVVTEADYLNPHIRPWASKRTVEDQLADVDQAADGWGYCLYPTPRAMEGRPEVGRWPNEPYRTRMASGAGSLDLAYFSVDVIEHYRNDPRYHFDSGDFEVHLGIGDDAYLDPDEDDRDKIASMRVGFAYDRETIRAEQVTRLTCTFLCDLDDLTPEHQQRWRSYEVEPNATTEPHPVWWAMQMGNWPDGFGPFDRILREISAVNEIFELICGESLFSANPRPREWGWVLRPSTQEWHQFLLSTDKLLSESLRHAALSAVGVPRQIDDGIDAGSIARLRWYLENSTPTSDDFVENIVEPLQRVRRERQKPAHTLVVPTSDAKLTAMQRDLLHDVASALHMLRQVLALHPSARDVWSPPDYLDEGPDYLV